MKSWIRSSNMKALCGEFDSANSSYSI